MGYLELAARHANVWMDLHGQGVTVLAGMIERLGGERLLYGTDMPLPQTPVDSPLFHAKALGWHKTVELARIKNPWDRDLLLKRELGVPDEVFTRANALLRLNTQKGGIR